MRQNIAPIKLTIVDNDQLIVKLLENFFNHQIETKVLWTSNDEESFWKKLTQASLLPDVILLALNIKTIDPLETIMLIRKQFPSIKIIIISSNYNKTFIGHLFKKGASSFLPKRVSPEELINIIQVVAKIGYYFMPDQIEIIRTQVAFKSPKPSMTIEERISKREKEVLTLICQQYTAQEIAKKLFITKRTVEGHKTRLLSKTGVKNTAGLVVFAIQKNIIDISTLNY